MSSIVSKLADEIKLHGSYEAYCAFRDSDQVQKNDPEVVPPKLDQIQDDAKKIFHKEDLKQLETCKQPD